MTNNVPLWSQLVSSSNTTTQPGFDHSLARLRFKHLVNQTKHFVNSFKDSLGRVPFVIANQWLTCSEAQRTTIGLIAIMLPTFALWHVTRAQAFATKWFTHTPVRDRPLTMLTSIFSHQSLPHFAFNSIALYSLGSACHSALDRHQDNLLPRATSRFEFLAMFVCGGLIASLGSHLVSLSLLRSSLAAINRRISNVASQDSTRIPRAMIPSLGASALEYPQASVSLIFLPFVPIPIGSATVGLMTIDLIGLIRGWKMFDHAAHLSGGLFGWFWFEKGHEWFERLRISIN
ncbi:hypothetical protein OIO90_005120 [Microbotryomycetes sp. JL221]|nr:hypothetical protein OIO90_005120 [Microbotryomycetes sp. JL221]